ncbi:potassium transporter [Sulfurimonas sediminis]|uniref:Potassium transporter n=1 Tax=Sulfurimonas sediminis TaxID=2590020 RepID=A0A7M1B4S6_9BACT|nr:cation:proton antiporter [Sulfurimonas sediminis]QOP44645.1 potassium transporter [Sulfurimonas sediminis]
MQNVLVYIIIALGLSIVINIFLKKIGISQIIGYILTGTLIAYGFDLHKASHSHALEMAGEFGIVFLMFTIGLEISLAKMGSMKREIFANGFLQVGLTTVVTYLLAHYIFALGPKSSIIIALAFSLSSTAIVLTYLKSSKEIYTPYGQNATGILIFQDIAVIPILILISFLSKEGDQKIFVILWHTLLSVSVVIAVMFTFGKRVVAWLLHFSSSSEVDELFMGSVLFIVMASSLFAYYMGFTYSLGAFVAGMIIAETKYHHKVESDIAPFKDILLGTFFVVVGMKIDIFLFLDNIGLIIGLFLLIFIIKSLLMFLVLRLSSSSATSLKTALFLSQVGEFSFVIFALAASGHIIDEQLASLLVLIVIFSMIVTPFFVPFINAITTRLIKEKDIVTDMSALKGRENHVVVCGYSVVGKFVTQYLEELDVPYVIIDNSNKHVQEALEEGREAYLGDASKTAILQALHIEKAAAIIVTLDNIAKKRLICEAVLNHSRNANLIVKVVSLEEKEKLSDLKITNIVDGKVEVARVLVERMLTCQLKYR